MAYCQRFPLPPLCTSLTPLGQVADALDSYRQFVTAQVARARSEPEFAAQMNARWQTAHAQGRHLGHSHRPDPAAPRAAVPRRTRRHRALSCSRKDCPASFRFSTPPTPKCISPAERKNERPSARPTIRPNGIEDQPAPVPAGGAVGGGTAEEPTRLFAGMGLAEDTNERFHYLSRHQRSKRLSTAFDGPTLYGTGCGRGRRLRQDRRGRRRHRHRRRHGTALRRVRARPAQRLGVHDHQRPRADHPGDVRRGGEAAFRRGRGPEAARHHPGRRAQGSAGAERDDFPARGVAALPRATWWNTPPSTCRSWYPISISGYHIAEAGATPVQQAAYTLSNGFAYVELFKERGHGREPVRAAPVVLPRLRVGHRIPVPRAGLPQNLGGGHARCVRRGPARANPQAAHADERAFAHRRRVEEQPHAHGHRADPRVHERDELLPFQRRRRAIHHAQRGIRPARPRTRRRSCWRKAACSAT